MTSDDKPIKAFKYCHSKDVERIVAGSVKLSSLSYFRQLEEPEIGDEMEGTSSKYFDNSTLPQHKQVKLKIEDSETGEYHEIGGILHATITLRMDCLIYSCTRVRNDNLFLKKTDYDACVEILDLIGLGRQIFEELEQTNFYFPTETYASVCEYVEKTPEFPSLFTKRDVFGWQDETRVAFLSDQAIPTDPVHVNIDPTGLFRIVLN